MTKDFETELDIYVRTGAFQLDTFSSMVVHICIRVILVKVMIMILMKAKKMKIMMIFFYHGSLIQLYCSV